jgi:hypothetical protein
MSALKQGDSASRSVLIDIILSFAVYLVPLITIHALFPTGVYLMRSVSRLTESSGWVALDWIAMLAVQGMLFGLLRAARRLRAIGRTLLRVGAFAATVPAVNVILLWVIPVSYLVEESTAPEVNQLIEVCHVGGIALPPRVEALHVDATAAVLPVLREPDYGPALCVGNGHGPRSSPPMRRKRTPYRSSTASIATSALICLKLTHVVAMTHSVMSSSTNRESDCSYRLVSRYSDLIAAIGSIAAARRAGR